MTIANAIIEVASRTRNKEWTTVDFLAGANGHDHCASSY
jgi:hypothetical protein